MSRVSESPARATAKKPSGVPWLGDIPAHWEVKRFCFVTEIQKGRLPGETSPIRTSEDDLPYLSMEYLRGETDSPNYISAGSKLLTADDGDLLILWDGSNAGEFLRAKRGVVSSTVARVEAHGIDRDFLFHAAKAIEGQIKDLSIGMGIPHVDGDVLKSAQIPVPPPAEQRAIADFLDERTRRIDTLVARKRTLVERLREKRAALIARTVTTGLPPAAARAARLPENPPLRPSGVPWIGDIPTHWEIKQGRYIGTLLGSESPEEENFTDDETAPDSIPYAKVDDLNRLSSDLELTSTKARVVGFKAPQGPFLLFPKRGAAIFTNKVAIAKMNLLFDPNLMGWRIYPEFYPKFVAYCLISRRLDDLADTSTIPQINNKHIYPAPFPAPPIAEQIAIAAYLDRETGNIDRLITRVETAVERLLEYRSALITNAVTGKLTLPELTVEN